LKSTIETIIENKSNNHFNFYRNKRNPIDHLKEQSAIVPNESGIYLVFTEKKSNLSTDNCNHLIYEIENNLYELLYFGKAGGTTQNGKKIIQGLNGRINNVVSDKHRNLKDENRANYWNIIMNEFNINELLIIYKLHNNPIEVENSIYDFLDKYNLKYPLINKKRGRLNSTDKSIYF